MRIVWLLIVSSLLLFSAPLKITFLGNKAISEAQLYETLGLRKPYKIEVWEDQPVIDEVAVAQSLSALTSFYRAKGFYHAKVVFEIKEDRVIFTITENDPIIVKSVQVNSPIDVEPIIAIHAEERFDQDKFSETKSAIKKRYGERGFCNAQFNAKAWVDIETDEAHLLFEAEPGEKCTFGKIAVESTPNVDGKLTASMLRFDEGDPYSVNTIKQSYEALYAQEAVARAMINDNERNGSIVPITLVIEEVERPIRFTAGVGYSSDQGLSAQMGIKHRNFFGDLKTLALDARYTELTQEIAGTFTLPLQNRGVLGAEVGYKNETFDGYKTESTYEKVTAKYQDSPASVMAGLLFDRVQTYDSSDPINFPDDMLFITSPLGEINIDTRDKILEPTRGFWLNAKATGSLLSPVFSDATYFKSLLSGAYITSAQEQHVVGGKIKWGTLRVYDGDVPASYRFYAGGMNSNRAYTYRDLGPKNSAGDPLGFPSLLEGSLEYRFPISGEFRGVLFSDLTFIGDDYIPDYDTAYWGVGAGLRYVTPIGPIAVDVGFDPDDTTQYAIHFRIGELF